MTPQPNTPAQPANDADQPTGDTSESVSPTAPDTIGYATEDRNFLNIDADIAQSHDENGRNFARVGSARPSTLTFTYGPGSVMDLPNFTIMPAGLAAWNSVYDKNNREVVAPRLLKAVQYLLGNQVSMLRGYPSTTSTDIRDISATGIPARVFPQYLRCTKCHLLGRPGQFSYSNNIGALPDRAKFEHKCGKGNRGNVVVPTSHLLVCADGHADEFPYSEFVHNFAPCPRVRGEGSPQLKLQQWSTGRATTSMIKCSTCGAKRSMQEAQGADSLIKLPRCRGRHPHLDAFDKECGNVCELILVGASNLWFPATQAAVVIPTEIRLSPAELKAKLRAHLPADGLEEFADNPRFILKLASSNGMTVDGLAETDIAEALAAEDPELNTYGEVVARRQQWDPISLLEPEWRYLASDARSGVDTDDSSGLVTEKHALGDYPLPHICRVLGVPRLRKATAVLGFTRIDAMDRIGDLGTRLAPLVADRRPTWVPTAEDRGEGMFLQFDDRAISEWERRVVADDLWQSHVHAHRRNFYNRASQTSTQESPDDRFPPPRYWLLHTLSHVLLRELAISSGYGSASISERIYAWQATAERDAAAGIMLHTTASDSDGTLGGLVRLSSPKLLKDTLSQALQRARRCSTDPICAMRVPNDPEDFLHGAACHCCCMASETSCENANRFLDRKFLFDSAYSRLGFFDGEL